MVGTPVVVMHIEPETEACTCDKLSGCGGIESISVGCPEHSFYETGVNPMAKFHTHPQQVDGVNQGGRWIK